MSSRRNSRSALSFSQGRRHAAVRARLTPLAAAAAAAFAMLAPVAHGANVTWVGLGSSSFWDLAGNWNPGIPLVGDDVLLGANNTTIRFNTYRMRSVTGTGTLGLTGGILSMSQASGIGTLALGGGTLSGPSTFTAGTLSWTSGTMGEYEPSNFGGVTTITGAATISGDAGKQLYYGRVLNLNGGATWSGAGSINMTDATTIGNPAVAIPSAVINLAAGQIFDDQGSGSANQRSINQGIFNNAGTYLRSAGSNDTFISSTFNNTGTLSVLAGTVRLGGGGVSTGNLSTASGATLRFESGSLALNTGAITNAGTLQVSSGTHTIAAPVTYSGSGTLAVSGGTLRVRGDNIDPTALSLSGGTLSGPGTLTVTTLSWTSGFMGEYEAANFGGTTTVTGEATLSGDGGKQLYYGRVLNLNGGAVWSGAGSINLTDASSIGTPSVAIPSAVLNIAAGTTFDDRGSGSATQRNITQGIVNNAGTYLRSAGSNNTFISSTFNNTGTLTLNAGSLTLAGGGSSSGNVNVAAGSQLNVQGGTFAASAGVFTIDGTLRLQSGTLSWGPGLTVTGSGPLVASGGTLDSAVGATLTPGSMNLSGGTMRFAGNVNTGVLTMSGGTLSGGGTVTATSLNWTGGTMGEFRAPGFGGTTTITGAATISEDGGKQLYYGRVLNLNGGAVWSGAGTLTLDGAGSVSGQPYGAATVNLAAGQTFDDRGSGSTTGRSINQGVFNNAGTYLRSAGSNNTFISAVFNNTGTLTLNAGSLTLAGGGSSTGNVNVATGTQLNVQGGTFAASSGAFTIDGTLRLQGGALNWGPGVTVSGNGALVATSGTLDSAVGAALTPGSMNLSGGTLRFAGNVDTGVLTMSGGTLSGGGTVTATSLNWTGGTMGESRQPGFGGTTTISGQATLSEAGKQLYYGRVLNLNGGAAWSGAGTLTLDNAGTVSGQAYGAATINLAAGQTFDDQGSGSDNARGINQGVFNNAGTYLRSAGSNDTSVSARFNNTGTVDVRAGTMRFSGTNTSTGTWRTDTGTTLRFESGSTLFSAGSVVNNGALQWTSGTHTVAAPVALSGTGSMLLSGGTLRVQGNAFNPSALTMSGGLLSGFGTLTAGTLAWSAGTMGEFEVNNFGGATTVTGVATISGSGGKQLYYGRVLNLNGGAVWSGGGTLTLDEAGTVSGQAYGASAINIAAATTFDDRGSGSTSQRNISQGSVNNAGTYLRSAGSNDTVISARFNNTGTVDIDAGTMRFSGTNTSTGTWNTATGTTLRFDGGSTLFSAGGMVNDGALQWANGTHTVAAPVTLAGTGTMQVSGGTLRVQGNAFNPTTLTLTGGALSGGGTLTAGTLDWSAGTMGELNATHFGGRTTVTGLATLSTSGSKLLYYGRVLDLQGGANWTGTGSIFMTDATSTGNPPVAIPQSRIELAAGQTFDDQGSASARSINNGLFANAGTYLKSSGTGETTITRLTNSATGAITVQAGAVTISSQLGNFAGTTLTGGSYNVIGNSTLRFQGANVVNNAASILLDGAGSAFLNTSNVNGLANFATNTAAGSFTIRNGRNFNSVANFTNNGVVNLGSASTFTVGGSFFSNNVGGTLQMAGGTLAGTALANAGGVNGFGTINPTVGNDPTGIVLASGGTLNLLNGVQGSTGTLQVASGATLNLASSTLDSTAGTFTVAGNANLGDRTLTVFNDYDNTAFGVGNSFSARANISGAGQLLGNAVALGLGGDAQSAGANTYTLDFGVVRGGTTATRTFQIANTGTGAAVRGALQTGAPGGGNLSDARLSGSGTVAGNFGPITAGNNGGNLGVVLNAGATGGALAGQSLRVVGNFDNVAAQTLNISGFTTVLANGSATPSGLTDLGNFRVGIAPAVTATLDVTNTTAGAGAESLGIASVGTTGNFVAVNQLGAGLVAGGDSAAAAVRVSSSASGVAGINNGSLSIQFASNGQAYDNSLTNQNVNQQTVDVLARGYRVAQPTLPAAAVDVGNYRLASGATSSFTIVNTNLAPAGFQEQLNATAGTTSAGVTLAGSFSGLAAGAGSNAMTIGFAAGGAAGARTGSALVNFVSDGTGTSGLGLYGLPAGTVLVAGTAFNEAVGLASPSPVVVANQRVGGAFGGSASRTLTVANAAPTGLYSEALNASFSSQTGAASGSGSFANLAAGASNASAMVVTVDNTSAGLRSGTVTLAYATDGSGSNGNSGLSAAAAGSQTLDVSGSVFRLASASAASPAPVQLGAQRVDGTLAQTLTIGNTAANDGFSERLNVTAAASGAATASGSITRLGAGATSSAIAVGVDTTTAGAKSGSVQLNLASDGTGTSGFGAAGIGAQNVAVSGNVYAPAVASVAPSVSIGIVHVGDTVVRNIGFSNTAAVAGLNDALRASASGGGAPFSASGDGSAAAGQANNSSLQVALDTRSAGIFNGSALVTLASTNPEMDDLDLGSVSVALSAQVNNFAVASLSQTGGAGSFSGSGTVYTLNLGTVVEGQGLLTSFLALANTAAGPADLLGGSFDLSSLAGTAFGGSGFGPFSGIAAGSAIAGLTVSFDTGTIGSYSSVILLDAVGSNASGYAGALPQISLRLEGSVVAVPEPSTYALMAIGLLLTAGWARRARRNAEAGAAQRSAC